MKVRRTKTIILGGGLAGLSTAYFSKVPVLIIEKNDTPGGLCRSYTEDGFTFDHTGHLLHFRRNWTKALVKKLLKGNIKKISRNAAIFSHGRYTPYPFQANTYGLTPEIVKDCLLGFIQTLLDSDKKDLNNYESWINGTFGRGIAEHFMIPYNKKLWLCDLKELTTDWVSEYIPKPKLEAVLDGALGIKTHPMGYNAYFYYPKIGAIQSLVDGFLSSVKNLKTGTEVTRIDVENRLLHTSNGEELEYDHLISSIPLRNLIDLITPKPSTLEDLKNKLDYVSVFNINLGVARERISPYHWIYFPEEEFVFYRCGFPTNFSEHIAPEKTSSIYVEISFRGGDKFNENLVFSKTLDGLAECGILKSGSEIIHKSTRLIEIAYVKYTHARKDTLSKIFDFLSKSRISTIGRFGAWEYSAMEEAIIWGKNTAESLSDST